MIRQVKDEDGRVWKVQQEDDDTTPGRDVNLVCRSTGIQEIIRVKASWQWRKMAERGLARLILAAAR